MKKTDAAVSLIAAVYGAHDGPRGSVSSCLSQTFKDGGADVFLDQLCDQSELSPVLDRTDPSK